MSSLSHRSIDPNAAPKTTPPVLRMLGDTALRVLGREGREVSSAEWVHSAATSAATQLEIRCSGPRLPSRIPETLVRPSEISGDPRWQATWRLSVRAPLVVLDLAWAEREPLRILVFSRGDWETRLLEMERQRCDSERS